MVRTLVSLQEEDKDWLDRRSAEEGVPMTELIRRAVRLLRQHDERSSESIDELLDATRGMWRGEDGLTFQERIRGEW